MEVSARISDITAARNSSHLRGRRATCAHTCPVNEAATTWDLTRRELNRPVISFHSRTYQPENTRVATTVPFGNDAWVCHLDQLAFLIRMIVHQDSLCQSWSLEGFRSW